MNANFFLDPAIRIGLQLKEHIKGTRMTRITQIIADKTKKIGVNPRYQRHPRSIIYQPVL